MGYRLLVAAPSAEGYTQIFHRYAKSVGIKPSRRLLSRLLSRYGHENQRAARSEPRTSSSAVRLLPRAQRAFRLDDEVSTSRGGDILVERLGRAVVADVTSRSATRAGGRPVSPSRRPGLVADDDAQRAFLRVQCLTIAPVGKDDGTICEVSSSSSGRAKIARYPSAASTCRYSARFSPRI
jgi:hypothetical protein